MDVAKLCAAAVAGTLAGLGCETSDAPPEKQPETATASTSTSPSATAVATASAPSAPTAVASTTAAPTTSAIASAARPSAVTPPKPPKAMAGDPTARPRSKDCCKGLNECKGKGMCKTERHDCRGKNECKGLGGCKPADCG